MRPAFVLAPDPDPEAAERGRKLFAGPCDFVKGVTGVDALPPADRPEVAFAGRSNVGKSSLINALTGRRGLARASNTPGRTREINFFALGPALYIVDLPGYGFAEAPKAAVTRWQELMRAYLAGRPTLRRAFLLIDARHGPKPPDEEIMDLLDRSAVAFQAVLTKADKPSARDLDRAVEATAAALARHPAAFPEIAVTSAETGRGIATLRSVLAGLDDAAEE
jgi:ribosome biogenesis GTP-binding protein YsxC/EngB